MKGLFLCRETYRCTHKHTQEQHARAHKHTHKYSVWKTVHMNKEQLRLFPEAAAEQTRRTSWLHLGTNTRLFLAFEGFLGTKPKKNPGVWEENTCFNVQKKKKASPWSLAYLALICFPNYNVMKDVTLVMLLCMRQMQRAHFLGLRDAQLSINAQIDILAG